MWGTREDSFVFVWMLAKNPNGSGRSQGFASGNPYAFGKLGGETKLLEEGWRTKEVVLLSHLCADTSSPLEKTAIRKYSKSDQSKYSKELRFSYKEHTHIGSPSYASSKSVRVTKTLVQRWSFAPDGRQVYEDEKRKKKVR